MENYLIDPMWFYFAGLFETLRNFTLIFGVMGFIVYIFWYLIAFTDKDIKPPKNVLIIITIMLLVGFAVPSEKTMYKMMLAKVITYDNLENATEQGRELVEFLTDELNEIIDNVQESE